MKNTAIIVFAATAFFLAVSCSRAAEIPEVACGTVTDAPEDALALISDQAPSFIREAAKNAPSDALVGIGSARMSNRSLSRSAAQARAMADISRQLDSVVSVYTDIDSATEITVKLSQTRLQGVVVIAEDFVDGEYWVAVMLPR